MFNMNVKTKFIELKAAGMPMYKIANELGVHRATIMRWNRELAPYILIARQDAIDEILFENGCMKINRIERISKTLSIYYAMLEINETETEHGLDSGLIIERIMKLTKLLMIETTSKSVESEIKADEELLTEFPEIENGIDATVWVTDKEKFVRYQPDEEVLTKTGKDLEEYVKDLAKRQEENTGFINSHPQTVQDISEKAPEIQEVFKRTLARKNIDGIIPEIEKTDKKVRLKAKDLKIRMDKKRRK
jgi:hypothetical protein